MAKEEIQVGIETTYDDTGAKEAIADAERIEATDPKLDVTADVPAVTPLHLYYDVPFDIVSSIASFYDTAIGPFEYSLYLVAPGQTVPTTAPIFTSNPMTLAPFQSTRLTDNLSIPSSVPTGRYHIALVVDTGAAAPLAEATVAFAVSFGSVRNTRHATPTTAVRATNVAIAAKSGRCMTSRLARATKEQHVTVRIHDLEAA